MNYGKMLVYHGNDFNSWSLYARAMTIIGAIKSSKEINVEIDDWKRICSYFRKSHKTNLRSEMKSIVFCAEFSGDRLIVDQTGLSFFNKTPGEFNVLGCILDNNIKIDIFKHDPIALLTVENNSNAFFQIKDQNEFDIGNIPPSKITKLLSWYSDLIIYSSKKNSFKISPVSDSIKGKQNNMISWKANPCSKKLNIKHDQIIGLEIKLIINNNNSG